MWTTAFILCLGNIFIRGEDSEAFPVVELDETASPVTLMLENQQPNSSIHSPGVAGPKTSHPPTCLESAGIRDAQGAS